MKNSFKYIYILLVFLFLNNSFVVAESRIEAENDTIKINNLIKLCKQYSLTNKEKAIGYAEKAITLSNKINFNKGKANALYELGLTYSKNKEYNSALKNLKEAADVYKKIKDKKSLINCNIKIGNQYYMQGRNKEALNQFYNTIQICEENNFKKELSEVFSNIALIYENQKIYDKSLACFKRALQLSQEIKDISAVTNALNNIGSVYFYAEKYKDALEYYNKALNISDKYKDTNRILSVLNNIAILNIETKKFDKAIDCYLKTLKIYKEIKDNRGIYKSLNNLGLVYMKNSDNDKAYNYFLRAIKLSDDLQDLNEKALNYQNLGVVVSMLGKSQMAVKYLYQSIEISKTLKNDFLISASYNKLGNIYYTNNRYNEAIKYFDTSLTIARKNKFKILQKDNFNIIAKIYAANGDYKAAYNYSVLYNKISDTICKETKNIRYNQLELGFDFENKENEIATLKSNNEANAQKLEKEIIYKNFMIVVIGLALLLLFIAHNRYLIVRNSNRTIKKQKIEINKKNSELFRVNAALNNEKDNLEKLNIELTKSETKLLDLNASKDNFFSIVSHDLRGPIATVVSFIRILKNDIDKYSKEQILEFTLELEKSISQITDLLENLLQWSRTQTGRISYNPLTIKIADLVDDNIQLFAAESKGKNITISSKVDKGAIAFTDTIMLNTIIRNLISNAVKYSKSGGNVEIDQTIENDFIKLSIIDQGVGISSENLQNLFDLKHHKTTRGTNDEKGSGLGLILCKELIDRIGGVITVESTEGSGSKFTITVPLSKE